MGSEAKGLTHTSVHEDYAYVKNWNKIKPPITTNNNNKKSLNAGSISQHFCNSQLHSKQ